jgi:hypothetical protein
MDLEELEDRELEAFRERYEKLAARARKEMDEGTDDTGSPEP